jgi:hypothetical protein
MLMFRLRPQQRVDHGNHIVTDVTEKGCLTIRLVVILCKLAFKPFDLLVSEPI